MSEGWQVGDLALCVANKHAMFIAASSVLEINRIYTVSRVGSPISFARGERALGLDGAEPVRGNGFGFPETLFRKIKPDTEPCEEEFTALVKRGRKVSA